MTSRARTDTDLSHVYYWKTVNVETVSVSKWKVNNKICYCFPLYFIYKYEQRNIEKRTRITYVWCVTLLCIIPEITIRHWSGVTRIHIRTVQMVSVSKWEVKTLGLRPGDFKKHPYFKCRFPLYFILTARNAILSGVTYCLTISLYLSIWGN